MISFTRWEIVSVWITFYISGYFSNHNLRQSKLFPIGHMIWPVPGAESVWSNFSLVVQFVHKKCPFCSFYFVLITKIIIFWKFIPHTNMPIFLPSKLRLLVFSTIGQNLSSRFKLKSRSPRNPLQGFEVKKTSISACNIGNWPLENFLNF